MAFSLRKFRNSFKLHYIQNVRWKSTTKKSQILEIGSFEPVKSGGYSSGQCFLHRVFAYRGIILCPWKAQLLDRDDKESPKVETYYQALIDERDYPHTRVQSEVGKFLGQVQKTSFMFAVSGLDQVSHNDIIPYKPTTDVPIQHYLFNKFFVVRTIKNETARNIVPKIALHDWRRRHLPWLYYAQVHKMVTDNMRVTAMAFYMGRRKVTHWWRYIIRVENLGADSVILQGQRWGIYTGNGELQTVRGIGILGHLPVLSKESPAIQYSSHVTLLAPRGHMWGYYLVQKQTGENNRTFLCPVPSFGLESSSVSSPVKSMPK